MNPNTRIVSERIDEGTVGILGDEGVAAGNAYVAKYQLPCGRVVEGPTIALYLTRDDQKHRVGVGGEVSVGGRVWVVSQIVLGESGSSWIELQSENSIDRSPATPETLDFLISSRCDRCGGRTGWDGSVDCSTGRVIVGTRCIRCPEYEPLTGGAVEQWFVDGAPLFTPGRGL